MGGSFGLLARGASQKKWASSAHIPPPARFVFSTSAFTASESGFAGAAGGPCADTSAAQATQQERLNGAFFSICSLFYRVTPTARSRFSGCTAPSRQISLLLAIFADFGRANGTFCLVGTFVTRCRRLD